MQRQLLGNSKQMELPGLDSHVLQTLLHTIRTSADIIGHHGVQDVLRFG